MTSAKKFPYHLFFIMIVLSLYITSSNSEEELTDIISVLGRLASLSSITLSSPIPCNDKAPPSILYMVHSAPINLNRRMALRQTWAAVGKSCLTPSDNIVSYVLNVMHIVQFFLLTYPIRKCKPQASIPHWPPCK